MATMTGQPSRINLIPYIPHKCTSYVILYHIQNYGRINSDRHFLIFFFRQRAWLHTRLCGFVCLFVGGWVDKKLVLHRWWGHWGGWDWRSQHICDPKNEGEPKYKDDPKMKTTTKMKMTSKMRMTSRIKTTEKMKMTCGISHPSKDYHI